MQTASLNPGRLGSKRQSWSEYNPRELIKDAVRAHPRASEAEIRNEVWEVVKNEKEYMTTVFDYWFANNYRSFFIEEIEGEAATIVPIKKANGSYKSNQPTRAEVDEAKEKLRPILMDQILSSGKTLREVTFKDCEKGSGWLKEVSKHGKPTEVVGKHLTEQNLWNLRKRVFDK
jgi:hypothetical protein